MQAANAAANAVATNLLRYFMTLLTRYVIFGAQYSRTMREMRPSFSSVRKNRSGWKSAWGEKF
jgi:hypothetical protein